MRDLRIGVGGVLGVERESPVPYGKEKGDSGHGAYLGLDLGTSQGPKACV